MPNSCFILSCQSGKKLGVGKAHMFSPPKDPEEFKKWSRACSQKCHKLRTTSKICQNHFKENEIRKATIMHINGSLVSMPFLNWRLEPHSVPSIFGKTSPRRMPLATGGNLEVIDTPAIETTECSTSMDGHDEHLETSGKPNLELKNIITEAIGKCGVSDTQDCLVECGHMKELKEETTINGPVITPFPELESVILTGSTGIDESSQTNVDGSAHAEGQSNHLKKPQKDWKNRASQLLTLYKRWKNRYHRLNKRFEKLKGRGPREGLFVPYSNLNQQEIMYLTALARKANAKGVKGMRYTEMHKMECLLTSFNGKTSYESIRKNSNRPMPCYRTMQKFRSRTSLETDVPSQNDVDN